LGNFYGLAMPLVMNGLPVTPVQLENVTVSNYLAGFKILYLSYDGQKPLSPEVHAPIADWVKHGGVLVFCDADADPYLKVREWWNSNGDHFLTPRQHLFAELGVDDSLEPEKLHRIGHGGLIWLKKRPAEFSFSADGADQIMAATKLAARRVGLKWRETNYLLLRRGPYVIASGLDESNGEKPRELRGRFVNLFDSELRVQNEISIVPGSRWFLLDLKSARTGKTHLLASAGKALLEKQMSGQIDYAVEGVGDTPGILLLESAKAPKTITLDGKDLPTFEYSAKEKLLWVHFENKAQPQTISVLF
jgi:hypothetical protein